MCRSDVLNGCLLSLSEPTVPVGLFDQSIISVDQAQMLKRTLELALPWNHEPTPCSSFVCSGKMQSIKASPNIC